MQPIPPETRTRRTRVVCVDDAPDMTDMLAMLMLGHADLLNVGMLDSVVGLVGEVLSRKADVVVVDLTIPGESPLGAIRALTAGAPLCRVIAYSGYDDLATREAARLAGAVELVGKRGEPDEIIHAIRRVAGVQGSLPAPQTCHIVHADMLRREQTNPCP